MKKIVVFSGGTGVLRSNEGSLNCMDRIDSDWTLW